MITVVNMIPQSLSGETQPGQRAQHRGQSRQPEADRRLGVHARSDGRRRTRRSTSRPTAASTWSLNTIVPSAGGDSAPATSRSRFVGTSSRPVHAAILDGGTGDFEVHPAHGRLHQRRRVMTALETRANEDQPYVAGARRSWAEPDAGNDRVYIGVNDFNAPAARRRRSSRRSTAAPPRRRRSPRVRVETRDDPRPGRAAGPARGPPRRHGLRRVLPLDRVDRQLPREHAGHHQRRAIVVRDDNWGTGATPFTALDRPVGRARRPARRDRRSTFPFNQTGVAANGQERWGGDIAIAVDPRNSSTVYVAWLDAGRPASTRCNVVPLDRPRRDLVGADLLHDHQRDEPGARDQQPRQGRRSSTSSSPAPAPTQRWETHFRELRRNGTTWSDTRRCARRSRRRRRRTFSPYIGDYAAPDGRRQGLLRDLQRQQHARTSRNFPQGVTLPAQPRLRDARRCSPSTASRSCRRRSTRSSSRSRRSTAERRTSTCATGPTAPTSARQRRSSRRRTRSSTRPATSGTSRSNAAPTLRQRPAAERGPATERQRGDNFAFARIRATRPASRPRR